MRLEGARDPNRRLLEIRVQRRILNNRGSNDTVEQGDEAGRRLNIETVLLGFKECGEIHLCHCGYSFHGSRCLDGA
jgi:hypothetical protein